MSATATAPRRPLRRVRTHDGTDHRTQPLAPLPLERQPPCLVLRRRSDLLLVTPWPVRKHGLSCQEQAYVDEVTRWLRDVEASRRAFSCAWITEEGLIAFEPQDHAWVQRQLNDHIVLQVRA